MSLEKGVVIVLVALTCMSFISATCGWGGYVHGVKINGECHDCGLFDGVCPSAYGAECCPPPYDDYCEPDPDCDHWELSALPGYPQDEVSVEDSQTITLTLVVENSYPSLSVGETINFIVFERHIIEIPFMPLIISDEEITTIPKTITAEDDLESISVTWEVTPEQYNAFSENKIVFEVEKESITISSLYYQDGLKITILNPWDCIGINTCSYYDEDPDGCDNNICPMADFVASSLEQMDGYPAGCSREVEINHCEYKEDVGCVAPLTIGDEFVETNPGDCTDEINDGCLPALGDCGDLHTDTSDTCDNDGFLTYSWTGAWKWPDDNIFDESTSPELQAILATCHETGAQAFQDDVNGKWHYMIPSKITKYNTKCKGDNTVQCPEQVKLPFFNFINLLVAISLIAIIYILFSRKRK